MYVCVCVRVCVYEFKAENGANSTANARINMITMYCVREQTDVSCLVMQIAICWHPIFRKFHCADTSGGKVPRRFSAR